MYKTIRELVSFDLAEASIDSCIAKLQDLKKHAIQQGADPESRMYFTREWDDFGDVELWFVYCREETDKELKERLRQEDKAKKLQEKLKKKKKEEEEKQKEREYKTYLKLKEKFEKKGL